MTFLKSLRRKQADKAAEDRTTYNRLIAQAATIGDLADTDATALEAVAERLGIDVSRIESDVAVTRRIAELRPLVDALSGRQQAFKAATAAGGEIFRTLSEAASHRQQADALRGEAERRRVELLNKLSEAQQAQRELTALEAAHRELLGIEPERQADVPTDPDALAIGGDDDGTSAATIAAVKKLRA